MQTLYGMSQTDRRPRGATSSPQPTPSEVCLRCVEYVMTRRRGLEYFSPSQAQKEAHGEEQVRTLLMVYGCRLVLSASLPVRVSLERPRSFSVCCWGSLPYAMSAHAHIAL